MRPISNQSGKTHKFDSLDNFTFQSLKFRPVISQIVTYTNNAAKILWDFLKLVSKWIQNQWNSFPSQLKEQPLNEDEEYASYDVDSLFTNILVQEKIDYIIHRIYTKKKRPQICSKTIFRRLLLKVITECSFQLKQKLYKQTGGCSMEGPLSVTLADMHMIWTENDVVKLLKSLFYNWYVDDIYSRLKKNCTD